MGRRQPDPAWKHCTIINGKSNHVKCNYCSHTMWGGVSRMKEHLAKNRGDVIPCGSCPPEVATKMMDLLIEQALAKEERQRLRRESLEKMKQVEIQSIMNNNVDSEENESLERAIKESLSTYETEKKMAEMDNVVFEAACRESLRCYYEMEMKRLRGDQGCSSSGSNEAGPSHTKNEFPHSGIYIDIDSDYDSEF